MDKQHLNLKIMECVSNPIKCRLLIEILKSGETTAKLLAEKCMDIPQTTLYRNLKRMTEDGILKVVPLICVSFNNLWIPSSVIRFKFR